MDTRQGVAKKNLLIDQVNAEQQRTTRRIYQTHGIAWEKHGHQTEHHEYDQCHKQYAIAHGKVDFRLECEERER